MAIRVRGRAMAAALCGVTPVLAGLLVAPVPAQAQFSDGYRFLEAVRKKDGAKVEEALSEPGTTIINTRDVTSGETALHIVTGRRDMTWMRYLLGKGANVNLRDSRGVSPLQLATGLGFVEGAELLVSFKARLDDTNNAGETPLITAVHRRDTALMRVLLKAGADPDKADNSGRSARDYASLDGRNSPLLAEIQTAAKPKGTAPAAPAKVYGPTF